MRISDWSSDVCSSDLFVRDVAELLWLHTEHDPFGAPAGAKPFGERRELRDTRARRGERIDDRDRGRVKPRFQPATQQDRKSVVEGKSVSVRVDLGGRRIIKKKTQNTKI